MNIESILGITASIIAIGTLAYQAFQKYQKKDLSSMLTELADKNTSVTRQHRLLHLIDLNLKSSGPSINASYIKDFIADGRSKSVIFHDLCDKNGIEPTKELCIRALGYDEPKFRKDWAASHIQANNMLHKPIVSARNTNITLPQSFAKFEPGSEVVYLSALMTSQYPIICKRLTDILNKHSISFAFLEGTKDIWCRDYMPVQTPNGKLIQFKYDPSYLKGPKFSESRSDVKHVDKVNRLTPIFSDINLDGGNIVMYGNKVIITDRVYSENPDWSEENLKTELSQLLECEIIIIPSYKPEYDFTGHADGMMRFVDSDTVLVNNLEQDFVYMKKAVIKALDNANLKYINFPWFEHKINGNTDHAIGIYLNYLEVGNLIIMPAFGVPGNKDAEAFAKIKEVFPGKTIETIDYNDVALAGGILNCTTWIRRI